MSSPSTFKIMNKNQLLKCVLSDPKWWEKLVDSHHLLNYYLALIGNHEIKYLSMSSTMFKNKNFSIGDIELNYVTSVEILNLNGILYGKHLRIPSVKYLSLRGCMINDDILEHLCSNVSSNFVDLSDNLITDPTPLLKSNFRIIKLKKNNICMVLIKHITNKVKKNFDDKVLKMIQMPTVLAKLVLSFL